MKKLLFSFIVLAFLFCGCQAASEAQHSDTAGSTNLNTNGIFIERPIGNSITTYKEYEEFLQTNTLPYKCAHYNDLRHFGEFNEFYYHYTSFASDSNHRYLSYDFNDGSGMDVTLTFYSEMTSALDYCERISDADIELSDMRHSKLWGVYEFHGLYYVYYKDDCRLKEIFWLDEDTKYIITCFEGISNYPYGHDTLVSELLDLEGKSAADIVAILSGTGQ